MTEYYLEDILERTGFLIGRGSRYARKRKPTAGLVDAETGEEVPAVWQEPADEVDADDDEEDADTDAKAPADGKAAEGAKGARKAGRAGKGGGSKAATADAAAEKEDAEEEEEAAEAVPDSWDEALPPGGEAPSRLTRAPSAAALAAKAAAAAGGEGWADGAPPPPGSAAAASAAASSVAAARAAADAAQRARRDAEAFADAALAQYSETTRRSITNVDDSQINYGALLALWFS